MKDLGNIKSLEELLGQKFIPVSKISALRKKLSSKVLVFSNGVFDIIHPGHIDYLMKAGALGDVLWLGLNSDASVKRLKGSSRPVNSEMYRASVLSAFYFVDYVTVFTEDTPEALIEQIKPDVHVKGGDYTKEDLPETKIVESYGGRVEIIPFLQGFSSTNVIEKIRKSP